VIIDNRCTNIELVSPVYFTKDTTCHIQFPQQVNTNHIIQANFITGVDRDIFGGILLYRLQRKRDDESDGRYDKDKSTPMSTQLLVIWRYGIDKFYPGVWLIEHESTFAWDKDKLKRLYNVYGSQYYDYSNMEIWLLYDNIKLKTVYETSHGGLEMKVIISEDESSLYSRNPLWINSNR
jgi:hypothetical protein